jgi:hypothetical protein
MLNRRRNLNCAGCLFFNIARNSRLRVALGMITSSI